MSPPGLLDLPREIRDEIYREILCPPDGIHLGEYEWPRRTGHSMRLAQVSEHGMEATMQKYNQKADLQRPQKFQPGQYLKGPVWHGFKDAMDDDDGSSLLDENNSDESFEAELNSILEESVRADAKFAPHSRKPRYVQCNGDSYATVINSEVVPTARQTILRTNRQIYQEAKEVQFRHNVWTLNLFPEDIVHYLWRWGQLTIFMQHLRFTDEQFHEHDFDAGRQAWKLIFRHLRKMHLKSVTVPVPTSRDDDAYSFWDYDMDEDWFFSEPPKDELYAWAPVRALARELLLGTFDALRLIHSSQYPVDKDPRTMSSVDKLGYVLLNNLPIEARADSFNVAYDLCRPTEYGVVVALTRVD
ncbi:hypothetical protein EV356DRAFT_511462 [Viridothelium virens]|uniref:Uncharacterized protein n=1 Tax=Viridothelium virens TaxID=1048519 RepID=A0A6A6HGZ7_VIRVR|nr:hypothetical protein EV356DRAFT_511462 [Viridothelium virens]